MDSLVENKTKVWLQRFSSCSINCLADIIGKLNFREKIITANSIVIKPNLCAGSIKLPNSAVVTNPLVLKMVIETILLINPEVSIAIVESDSIGMGLASLKFKFQGYKELFSDHPQVQCVDLSRSEISNYTNTSFYFKQGVVLPKIVVERDLFISLGKMKTHTNTVITGILKNQFGCLPDSDKDKYHPYLSDVLSDINSVIKPDLCILEGCPAMEGPGPVSGTPKDLDLLIIGTDPVAVDATMARVMGFQPESIPILKVASLARLGTMDETKINIYGLPLLTIRQPFNFISKEHRFYIWLGFKIQRLGDSIRKLGHLVHSVPSLVWLIRKVYGKLKNVGSKRKSYFNY